jgi:hypothetical protein
VDRPYEEVIHDDIVSVEETLESVERELRGHAVEQARLGRLTGQERATLARMGLLQRFRPQPELAARRDELREALAALRKLEQP